MSAPNVICKIMPSEQLPLHSEDLRTQLINGINNLLSGGGVKEGDTLRALRDALKGQEKQLRVHREPWHDSAACLSGQDPRDLIAECLFRLQVSAGDGHFQDSTNYQKHGPLAVLTACKDAGLGCLFRSFTQALSLEDNAANYPDETPSINISPQDVAQTDYREWLTNLLTTYGKPVVLELLEEKWPEEWLQFMKDLADYSNGSVQLAVDDYGFGHHTANPLELLQPAYVKIAGEQVRGFFSAGQPQDNKLIRIVNEVRDCCPEAALVMEHTTCPQALALLILFGGQTLAQSHTMPSERHVTAIVLKQLAVCAIHTK
ncbi:MAG: EAL domain-containing protein [Holosporaceae bacterium]